MKPGILLVGSFLSRRVGSRCVGEEQNERLVRNGWQTIITSGQVSRIARLVDMLVTVLLEKKHYQAAYVEVYSGPAFLWAELVCGLLVLLKKPFVLALHGGNLPKFAARNPGRVERLLRSARYVTAPSDYLQEELRNYRADIILLPNPLDLPHYPFLLRDTPLPKLTWLRAFHKIYNPGMAVEVVDLLRSQYPDVRLEMIGPDKGDGSLQETQVLISQKGLQAHVSIIPGIPKNNVPEYLNRADIFLNTTTVDNTPVSVMEALACGLCVVSTNVGGLPYLLQDNQDALLVPSDDARAMAEAVLRLLGEKGLAKRMSQGGRKKAEFFDWSAILPQWEALFQKCLDG